jgi:hypothetical protein
MNSENIVDECPICFDKIMGVNNCLTPCGHTFCFRCIAESMNNNTSCPCCRTELVESKTNSSSGDDIEFSDEDDDEDDENDDDDEDDDSSMDPENMGNIEIVFERFTNRGYTLMDALMILLDRSSKTDNNYNEDYLAKISEDFDEMIEDLDKETYETNRMTEEDVNVNTISMSCQC